MLRIKQHPQILLLLKILLILSFLAFLFARPVFGQGEKEVFIFIQNGSYQFEENNLQPDQPVMLVINNRDLVRHGFLSTIFEGLDVEVEVNGIITYTKGMKGIHLDPGKTARIHFSPTSAGKFSFHCDLHPSLKGEMAILTFGAG